jgi:hypothetical protein
MQPDVEMGHSTDGNEDFFARDTLTLVVPNYHQPGRQGNLTIAITSSAVSKIGDFKW